MTVIDRDRGYKRLIRNWLALGTRQVLVGVRSRDGFKTREGDSLNLAGIASANEFGTADGRVPERSFLRSTVDENADTYGRMIGRAVLRHLSGQEDIDQGLAKLGARAVGDVQAKIVAIDTPPNAPSTVARKGADNPLIDTGRLRQSIDYEIRKG